MTKEQYEEAMHLAEFHGVNLNDIVLDSEDVIGETYVSVSELRYIITAVFGDVDED